MKRDMETLNLQDAFKPEPERCHAALMQAARSAEEKPKMKKAPLRAAWIVAAVLVVTVAAAFAANSAGLLRWFDSHYGIELPKAAQELLAGNEPKTITVGPIAFTIRDILSDGRVSYLAVEARTADGSPAVLYMGNGDPADSIGSELAAALDTQGIIARTSYADAARLLGLPLYSVDAYLTPKGDVTAGQEMMDSETLEGGALLLIDMLYTDPDAVGDTLLADVVLRAVEIDTNTLARKGGMWSAADARSVPVEGVTATRTYVVISEENLSVKFTVTRVTAEQTCAGVYITIHAAIDGGIAVMGLGRVFTVLDAQGNPYPRGISLTEECLDGDGNPLPTGPQARIDSLQYRVMITAETLPDSLMISNGNNQVLVEALPPAE